MKANELLEQIRKAYSNKHYLLSELQNGIVWFEFNGNKYQFEFNENEEFVKVTEYRWAGFYDVYDKTYTFYNVEDFKAYMYLDFLLGNITPEESFRRYNMLMAKKEARLYKQYV